MGTVVIHAGMPKTGSTSIQAWLAAQEPRLRRHRGVRVLVARPRERGEPRLRVSRYIPGGPLNSGRIVRFVRRHADAHEQLARDLAAGIAEHAERSETVVLTSEALAQLFVYVQAPFLRALDELAARHPVRVAYYVRPQHTALEASWRQWGFRSGHPASIYLNRRGDFMHYFATYEAVRERAPRISFEPRPFRPDLLDRGDVVFDFASRFLGVSDPAWFSADQVPLSSALGARARRVAGLVDYGSDDTEGRNLGLPLELVNVLSEAPADLLGDSVHDNARFERLKELAAGTEVEESARIRASRAVLHTYAYRTFEPENRSLLSALGWDTDHLIDPPALEQGTAGRELAEIEALWRPRASPGELALLYAALDRSLPRGRLWRRARRPSS